MIKKILRFGTLSIVLGSLSGCTLAPPKIGNAPASTEKNAFDTAALPGSIWRSDDGGQTFVPKTFVDEKRKLTKADVLSISFLQREDNREKAEELRRTLDVYVGTVDDMIFKTDDGAEVWQSVNFPPQKVYSFIASRRSIDRMYATGVAGGRGKIFRTTDGGITWKDVYTEPNTGTSLPALEEHPSDSNFLLAATSAGVVVKSLDGGDTWKNVGTSVSGPVVAIAFDSQDKDLAYILAFNGKIYVSRTAGDSWRDLDDIRAELTKERQQQDKDYKALPQVSLSGPAMLIADPNLSETLYVGAKNGLFRSRNAGIDWEKVNIIESAEQFQLRSLAVNPKNSKELIFAAGRAFYKSINMGETWSVVPLNTDRDISVITYDPVYPEVIYLGLRKMK